MESAAEKIDSATDYYKHKNAFKKVSEVTETALVVLAKEINHYGVAKARGCLKSAKVVEKESDAKWAKDFTLEFSKDRKSMTSPQEGLADWKRNQDVRQGSFQVGP